MDVGVFMHGSGKVMRWVSIKVRKDGYGLLTNGCEGW